MTRLISFSISQSALSSSWALRLNICFATRFFLNVFLIVWFSFPLLLCVVYDIIHLLSSRIYIFPDVNIASLTMLLPVLCAVVALLCSTSQARKHHLEIQNDVRQSIPLSTFGFYTGGLEGIFYVCTFRPVFHIRICIDLALILDLRWKSPRYFWRKSPDFVSCRVTVMGFFLGYNP